MLTPPARFLRSSFVMASCAVTAIAAFASAALADVAPPVLAVTVDRSQGKMVATDTTSGGTSSTLSRGTSGSSNSAGGSNKGKGGFPGGTGGTVSTVDSSTDLVYTITVVNHSPTNLTNLAVEYHIYNRTITTSGSTSSTMVADITSTENIDLASLGKKQIQTQSIPFDIKSSTTASSGGGGGFMRKGGGGGSSSGGGQTLSTTNVMGWYVEIKMGDKLIYKKGSSDNIVQQVANINKNGH